MEKHQRFEPLRPVLRHVEEELTNHIAEACSKSDVRAESTGELERLSDTLYEAAREARAAAAIRRRIRTSQIQRQLSDRLSVDENSEVRPDEPPPAA
jgi:hypothetical protein